MVDMVFPVFTYLCVLLNAERTVATSTKNYGRGSKTPRVSYIISLIKTGPQCDILVLVKPW